MFPPGPGPEAGSAPRDHAGDRDAAVDGLAEVEYRPVEVEIVGHHDRGGGAALTEDLVRELRILDRRVGVALLGDPPRRDPGATEPVAHRLRLGATVLRHTAGDDDARGRVRVGETVARPQPLLENRRDLTLGGQSGTEDDD